eukprot:750773-Amorphochlora_amoeboformis.AAC.1
MDKDRTNAPSSTHAAFLRAIRMGGHAGLTGSAAMSAQITSFMWLHTIMRYQYRHGTNATDTVRGLGGIKAL